MTDDIDLAPDEEPEEHEELITNPLKRIAMVIFSPGLVFRSLAAKRSRLDWIVPLCLSILCALVVMNAGYGYIRNDQHNAVVKRVENMKNLTEEQKTTQIAQAEKMLNSSAGFGRIAANVSAVLGNVIFLSLMALVMQAVTGLVLNGSLSFIEGFCIAALSTMVQIASLVVKIPLIFYFESFTQATLSLGFLFPENMQSSFLVRMLNFDLFTIWYLIVLSIGMSVFVKTTLAKAFVPMAALFVVVRIAAAAISMALGGLTG
jgi:hypothetical protein